MPKDNEYTTKFKVDITDLKKGITEANQQIKLANAEFKASSAGMDDWGKSADGISAKLKQLSTILSAQKSKLETYKKEQQEMDKAYAENGKRADELKQKMEQLASQGISKTSAEYKKYQKALVEIEKEQSSNAKASDDLKITILNQQAAVNKTEKEIRNYSKSLDELEREQKESADSANDSVSSYDKLKQTISEQEKELDKLKSTYANVAIEQGENSDEAKRLAKEIQELSTELKENKSNLSDAEKAADGFDETLEDIGDAAEKSANGFTVMKGALANLVADGIRMAIDAIKDFARETINVGKQFDSSMSRVAAVSGASGDELEALRDKAKEMGANTVFSASEAADAFNYMAMAGWKTEDMLNGIEGIMNLAAASGEDLATTSDIVTDALTAFGYSAADSSHFADVLATASSNANTNVGMMGETFKYVAPVAGSLGYSAEDTALAIGLIANSGIKASQAGTSLRSIFTRLATDAGASSKSLGALGVLTEKLGVEFYNADGSVRDLNSVLMESRNAWKDLTDEEQQNYAKKIAEQEAISAWQAIMNASNSDVEKLTDSLINCDGASKQMADTMSDNLGGDLTQLGSKLEGVQIAIYEKFEPALRSGVKVLGKLLDAVNFVVEHSTEFIAGLTAMGAAVAAYVAYTTAIKVMKEGWMALTVAQKAVTAAQKLMNVAMESNKIGLIIAAITALVAAFVYLWNNSEEFRNFWIGLWEGIKSVCSAVIDAIVGFFTETIPNAFNVMVNWISSLAEKISTFFTETIPNAFNIMVDWLSGLPEKISTFFSDIISKVATWASDMASKALEAGKNFLDNIVEFFKELPYKIGYFIGTALGKIIEFATTAPAKAKEMAKNFLDNVIEFFKQLPGKIWDFLTNVISNVINWRNDMIDKAKETASNFLDNVVEFFKQLPGKIADFLSNAISNVAAWVSNMVDKASELGRNFVNNVVTFFKELPGKIAEFLLNIISNVATWATNLAEKGKQAAKNLFDNVVNGIKELPSNVLSIGKDIVTGLWDGISGAAGWLADKVKEFASGIIDGIKDTLGIHSPSRVMRDMVGRFIPEGIAVGIEKNSKTAVNAMKRMASKLTPAMDSLKTGLSGSLRISKNPVVESGFTNQPSGITQNFYQYNNSPKSLSRLEIYRQTKNQLNFAKGG